jgi:hypothetical protein
MSRVLAALALAAGCATGPSRATPDAAVDAPAVRVACDGHLCDTTNGASCDAGAGGGGLGVAIIVLAGRRRRR